MSHIDYMVALFLSMATGLVAGYGFGWISSEMRHDREEFRRLMREAKEPAPKGWAGPCSSTTSSPGHASTPASSPHLSRMAR